MASITLITGWQIKLDSQTCSNAKLLTADVERCFSISKRALENRFSLSSTNLKRTMIPRNRFKCFGMRHSLQKVDDFPLEQ